jgi:hypothetical protein
MNRFSLTLVLLVLVCASVPAAAQQTSQNGIACIVDLPIPVYRGVFWIAQVTGEATVKISIGAEGATAGVEVESTQRALVAWLKSALAQSTFLKSCAGQTVEMKFVYRLAGSEDEDPRNEVRLKGPAIFEVIARPPVPHIQP